MNRNGELNYLAGFFDGEGTITGNATQRSDRKGSGRYRARMIVAVYGTDRTPLELFQKVLGGRINIHAARRRWGKRQLWIWCITSFPELAHFAEVMDGRLMVKARQFQLLKQYLATCQSSHCGSIPLTDEELNRRIEIVRKVQQLNRPQFQESLI